MKILILGDPHGKKIKDIPKDISAIFIPGDLGKASLMRKMAFDNVKRTKKGLPKKEYSKELKKKAFMEAYDSTVDLIRYYADISSVYIVFGNVESSKEETIELSEEIGEKLPCLEEELKKIKNVSIINNKKTKINNTIVGGINYFLEKSWVKNFKPSDYKEKMERAEKETKIAKKTLKNLGKVDILLCHQPPYGILDKVGPNAPKSWRNKHAGSKLILEYIKKEKPKYVVCGHIHESKGKEKILETKVINAGSEKDSLIMNIK